MTKPDALPATLCNFGSMPEAANVRVKTVAALYAVSVPTVWRWVKSGRLPKPRKLSERVTAWNVGELRAALSAAQ